MVVNYSHPTLGLLASRAPGRLTELYPRGCLAVVGDHDRIITASWPDDVDNSKLARVLIPEDDEPCDVQPLTAHALRTRGIAPTFADCVEQCVERDWSYSLELRFDDEDGPLHYVTISTGGGTGWQVVSSAADVDYAEALAAALVMALDLKNVAFRR